MKSEDRYKRMTHAEGCHDWGRGHYECAIEQIKKLESDLEGVRLINKLQAEALAEERTINRGLLGLCPKERMDALRSQSDAAEKPCS
jgi:hypothetical protein